MSDEAFHRLQRFIVDTRLASRLTQREVATRGGLPIGTVGNLEAGKRQSIPTQETLQKLAKGLGVPYDVLDRILRGMEPASPDDRALANLTTDLSPESKELLLSWLTMPESQRQAVEAGLRALIAALTTQSRQP